MKPTDSDIDVFRNFFEVMDFLIKQGWTFLQQESLTRIPNVIGHLSFMEGPIQIIAPEET